jgi:hypothetical protein
MSIIRCDDLDVFTITTKTIIKACKFILVPPKGTYNPQG